MRIDCPRFAGSRGYTTGFAKLAQGSDVKEPVVLVPPNAVMLPSGAPASFSALGTVVMPLLTTFRTVSTSDGLVISHGSPSCTVAKSSALPSSDGEVTVTVAGPFT